VASKRSLKIVIYRAFSTNDYRWTLEAANGRVLARSDTGYPTVDALNKSLDIVRTGFAAARVLDYTHRTIY
jgi:uncharacterized protein YegP (UPF0339 family)